LGNKENIYIRDSESLGTWVSMIPLSIFSKAYLQAQFVLPVRLLDDLVIARY
jgi:hypothetical protein